jgi:hypothetical protein
MLPGQNTPEFALEIFYKRGKSVLHTNRKFMGLRFLKFKSSN